MEVFNQSCIFAFLFSWQQSSSVNCYYQEMGICKRYQRCKSRHLIKLLNSSHGDSFLARLVSNRVNSPCWATLRKLSVGRGKIKIMSFNTDHVTARFLPLGLPFLSSYFYPFILHHVLKSALFGHVLIVITYFWLAEQKLYMTMFQLIFLA